MTGLIVKNRFGRNPKQRGVTIIVKSPEGKQKCMTIHGYSFTLLYELIYEFLSVQIEKTKDI